MDDANVIWRDIPAPEAKAFLADTRVRAVIHRAGKTPDIGVEDTHFLLRAIEHGRRPAKEIDRILSLERYGFQGARRGWADDHVPEDALLLGHSERLIGLAVGLYKIGLLPESSENVDFMLALPRTPVEQLSPEEYVLTAPDGEPLRLAWTGEDYRKLTSNEKWLAAVLVLGVDGTPTRPHGDEDEVRKAQADLFRWVWGREEIRGDRIDYIPAEFHFDTRTEFAFANFVRAMVTYGYLPFERRFEHDAAYRDIRRRMGGDG